MRLFFMVRSIGFDHGHSARGAIICFAWPPVPLLTLALFVWLWRALAAQRDVAPFLAALGLFLMCYIGLGISIWPMVVP